MTDNDPTPIDSNLAKSLREHAKKLREHAATIENLAAGQLRADLIEAARMMDELANLDDDA